MNTYFSYKRVTTESPNLMCCCLLEKQENITRVKKIKWSEDHRLGNNDLNNLQAVITMSKFMATVQNDIYANFSVWIKLFIHLTSCIINKCKNHAKTAGIFSYADHRILKLCLNAVNKNSDSMRSIIISRDIKPSASLSPITLTN